MAENIKNCLNNDGTTTTLSRWWRKTAQAHMAGVIGLTPEQRAIRLYLAYISLEQALKASEFGQQMLDKNSDLHVEVSDLIEGLTFADCQNKAPWEVAQNTLPPKSTPQPSEKAAEKKGTDLNSLPAF